MFVDKDNIMKTRMAHLCVLFLLIALDRVTKIWARNVLYAGDGARARDIVLIPRVLRLTFVKNTGAAFGFLSDYPVVLSALGLLILALVVFFYLRVPIERHYLPIIVVMICICAGALGNIIDRVMHGYVTDFVYFELIDFAVFNVADTYLTVSSFSFIFMTFTLYKNESFKFFIIRVRKKDGEGFDDEA